MKLAFCLFKYFPFGGLQRDFLRIARECVQRGHEVHVYTMQWTGERDASLHIHELAPSGWTNHGRSKSFIKQVQAELTKKYFDGVVGFNKMPGLDVYYAADVCYKARQSKRSLLYKMTPRYRAWVAQESGVFAAGNKTEVLLIAPTQKNEFIKHYRTEQQRFHLLPPGISRDRMRSREAEQIRARIRQANNIGEHEYVVLMVGSGFATKGVDRAVQAIAALPKNLQDKTHLFVLGADDPAAYIAQAQSQHVVDRIHFLGGRSDVPDFLVAADVLLHPAYYDNTATALLEAVVAGLPVLTTDKCGYAHYVQTANAGMVLASPFEQTKLNDALQEMLESQQARQQWQANALQFAQTADIYSMPQRAVEHIEHIGR